MEVHWGVICSDTAESIWALLEQESSEHKIVAVSTESVELSQDIARRFDIGSAYGSHNELINDPSVDRGKLSLRCLEAGKHVVCERPMTLILSEAKNILQVAVKKKLLCIEVYWSLKFLPMYEHLKEKLATASLGTVLKAQFNIGNTELNRLTEELGISVLDVVAFIFTAIDLVFTQCPKEITTKVSTTESGDVSDGEIRFTYSGKRAAQIVYTTDIQNEANFFFIEGTENTLSMEYPLYYCESGGQGLSHGMPIMNEMLANIYDCVKIGYRGDVWSAYHTATENTTHMMDTVHKQIAPSGSKWSRHVKTVAPWLVGAACIPVVIAAIPVAVGAAGFGAGGIAAGSLASSMMSAAAIANGGGVAAGGVVAVCQSIGATAVVPLAGQVAVGVSCLGSVAAYKIQSFIRRFRD